MAAGSSDWRARAKSHGLKRWRNGAPANKGTWIMQQQLSVITLGIADLARSRRFYGDGFGWTPVFANEDVAFYQMNGFVLGTWLTRQLEDDMQRTGLVRPGAFALAHNVATAGDVQTVLDRLAQVGGRILRPADAPPHGGMRGYIADPDDHAWEIAWNPAWPISPEGYVRFAQA
jgi:catechol 2,3-dioxygenase-like lactoylglutathione lyase family enzyme